MGSTSLPCQFLRRALAVLGRRIALSDRLIELRLFEKNLQVCNFMVALS